MKDQLFKLWKYFSFTVLVSSFSFSFDTIYIKIWNTKPMLIYFLYLNFKQIFNVNIFFYLFEFRWNFDLLIALFKGKFIKETIFITFIPLWYFPLITNKKNCNIFILLKGFIILYFILFYYTSLIFVFLHIFKRK